MDLVLEKEKAKKYIDSIQDEYFFKYFTHLLYEYETKQNLNPHTEEGLRNRFEKSMQDLENGTTISSEAMRERVKEWKK
jgi:hypothetical protein